MGETKPSVGEGQPGTGDEGGGGQRGAAVTGGGAEESGDGVEEELKKLVASLPPFKPSQSIRLLLGPFIFLAEAVVVVGS